MGTLRLLLDFSHHPLMHPVQLLLAPVRVLGPVSLIVLGRAGWDPDRRVGCSGGPAWFAIVSTRIVTARELEAGHPASP